MWSLYPDIFKELELVEELIKMNVSTRNELLRKVVSEVIEAGGKRLRPAFAIISCKFGKYRRKNILPFAGAIEILHTATLVHDDIIDKAKLRRGKTTVSAKYGVDMAVYAGDFLFTKAVLMLSKDVPVKRLEMAASGVRTICEGEVDQYRDRYNIKISVLSYLKKISKKTAVLFATACGVGAYLGKNEEKTVKSLAKFGFYFGMAFQIRDDINDFLSSSDISGKPVVNDISMGIFTLPVIYALNSSTYIRDSLTELISKKENVTEKESNEIIRLIVSSEGIEQAKVLLNKYIKRGIKALNSLPGNAYKGIFEDLISSLSKDL